jgi:hypothetical protein
MQGFLIGLSTCLLIGEFGPTTLNVSDGVVAYFLETMCQGYQKFS